MTSGFRGVWQTPSLRKLVAARFISNLGNGLGPIAIPFGVLALPNTNGTSLSIVFLVSMLSLSGFMLIGGVIGDKFPRAQMVGGADILLGILVLLNGISLITGNGALWIFIAVGFIGGFLNAIWYPSMWALTTDLADEKILQESNSAIGLSSNVAMIIGTSIGGILVATLGAGWAIFIDGITFIIAGLIVFSMRSATPVASHDKDESTLHQLRTGWREFSSRTWVFVIVISFSFLVAMERSVYSVVGPLVADKQLGGPKPWSFVLAAMSVGSVLGVLFVAKVKPKYPIRLAMITQFPIVLWFFSLGNTTNIFIIAFFAFLVGVALDIFYVLWITTLQQQIPKESLSKVMAYDVLGSLALAPLGLAIAGPIAEEFGSRILLDWITILSLITLIIPLLFRDVRTTTSKSN